MKATLRTLLFICPLFCGFAPAVSVRYNAQALGGDMFRLQYDVGDVTFSRNQELELRFHSSLFRSLSNPSGPAGFDILLIQPDNPLGAPGHFSALALADSPALTPPFSVDVRVFSNYFPGSHKFTINELDDRGVILRTVFEGDAYEAAPEPSTVALTGTALLIACAAPACRRRFRKTG